MSDAARNLVGKGPAPAMAGADALLRAADEAAEDMLKTVTGRNDKDVVKLDVRSFRVIAVLLRRLAEERRMQTADDASAYVKRSDLPDPAKMRDVAGVTRPLSSHLIQYAESADSGGAQIQGETLRLVAGLLDQLTTIVEGHADGIETVHRAMFENDRPII